MASKKPKWFHVDEAPQFRSRYTDADTSHLLWENQPWYILGCRIWRCLTHWTRRKLAFTLACLIIAQGLIRNPSSIWKYINDNNTSLSYRQSFGFIEEPRPQWTERKRYWQQVQDKTAQNDKVPAVPQQIPMWYKNHWNTNFECPQEVRINNMVLCNPSHLRHKHKCLVYLSGPPQLLTKWEEELTAYLHKSCEIHVFDPSQSTTNPPSVADSARTTNMNQLHPWGFTNQANSNSTSSKVPLLSLKDSQKILGHEGRTVDAFLLHCAGCEWAVYEELVSLDVRQWGVQLHNAKDGVTNLFFQTVQQNHYVTFYKQPVNWAGQAGRAQLYSFLKLKPQFFPKQKKKKAPRRRLR